MSAPNLKIFSHFLISAIVAISNYVMFPGISCYIVKTAECVKTCVTGTYAKRYHKNPLRFQKRPVLLTNLFHSVI